MTLYFYEKSEHHKSADTDELIRESIHREFTPCGEIIVKKTEKGKPYVNLPCHVGVTHTDKIVIIGVDDKNFGIDCEDLTRNIHRKEQICEKYFTQNERSFIDGSTDKNTAFLETWVKKEAYVKFTGEGLSGMKNCDVTTLSGFEKIENNRNLIIYIYKGNNNE